LACALGEILKERPSMTDQPKEHFVYRTTSGETLLESDAKLKAPHAGALIRLPSLSNPEELIQYRVKEVYFAPESPAMVIIFINVEPA
jgi:hypothetical protein